MSPENNIDRQDQSQKPPGEKCGLAQKLLRRYARKCGLYNPANDTVGEIKVTDIVQPDNVEWGLIEAIDSVVEGFSDRFRLGYGHVLVTHFQRRTEMARERAGKDVTNFHRGRGGVPISRGPNRYR